MSEIFDPYHTIILSFLIGFGFGILHRTEPKTEYRIFFGYRHRN
jgi:hypothetical protein